MLMTVCLLRQQPCVRHNYYRDVRVTTSPPTVQRLYSVWQVNGNIYAGPIFYIRFIKRFRPCGAIDIPSMVGRNSHYLIRVRAVLTECI